MITAWRLIPSQYIDTAISGVGGLYASGRWHSKGQQIVYAASSQALAVLEVLVHMNRQHAPDGMSLIQITFPDDMLTKLSNKKLPNNWTATPAPDELKMLGDEWLSKQQSVVLSVPTALVPDERNYILNPAHSSFSKVKIKSVTPFVLDERLLN